MMTRLVRLRAMRPSRPGADPACRVPLTRNLVPVLLLGPVLGLGLVAACAGAAIAAGPSGSPTFTGEKPAEVTTGEDGLKTLTLTEHGATRIGVETANVALAPDDRTIVPYSAGVYLPDGSSWVYVEIADFTYKRAPIEIHDITDTGIVLVSGPAAGMPVVTSGVPELWGLEDGVGG